MFETKVIRFKKGLLDDDINWILEWNRIGKCLQGQHKILRSYLFFTAHLHSWRWGVSRTLVTNLFFIRTFRVMAFESYSAAGISIKFLGTYNLYSLVFFHNLHLCYQLLLISRIFTISCKLRWFFVSIL